MKVRHPILAASVMTALLPLSASATTYVPVRLENRGQPVQVKQFPDGVQCDLSVNGRGIDAIGYDSGPTTRRHIDRDLVAGEPVEFVFLRKVPRPGRIGDPRADALGVRARMVPEAGLEYRVRVAHHATQLDAIVEARPIGSDDAFARMPVTISYDVDDFCLRGQRGGYAVR